MDDRTRATALLAAVIVAAFSAVLIGCGAQPEAAVPTATDGLSRSSLERLTIECSRVTDGQHTWLELAIEVDGQQTLRMPVVFKQGGRPVDIPDDQARSLIARWLKTRADEIAIFGTIGLSFGQASPEVTINVDQQPGGPS